ncbi:hypothetical protein H072_5621 [Dactylellina haptotyla CBS 200.50]|uniref:Ribosomal RNA-processing protein 43 n=1 Tax=Dactylellina haptotyla (strain CBS 200.50) TaxID=1284197 RepID=S8BYV3_DACHA|nr:hypothetical protein H072_5621 [Dactylellina haptotyla CBS 200.50]
MTSPTSPVLQPRGDSGAPLTFSTSLFRHISPSLYLQRHLLRKPPTRPNNRQPSQHRDLTLTTNSLGHAHGSAVVRAGDTAVVCGVRGEILTLLPGDDTSIFESYNHLSTSATHSYSSRSSGGAGWGELITPNVEISTGCSKKYPLGPPGALAQTLSDQLRELISASKLVELTSLRIYDQDADREAAQKIKGYWSIYVDILCISLDGNILDASWYAIVAALASAKLPLATWNQNEERIVCHKSLHHPVMLRSCLPFITTFAIVPVLGLPGNGTVDESVQTANIMILNDPDSYEEDEAVETLTILSTTVFTVETTQTPNVSSIKTRIERMEKIGGWKLGMSQLAQCIQLAAAKAAHYTETLLQEGSWSKQSNQTSASLRTF